VWSGAGVIVFGLSETAADRTAIPIGLAGGAVAWRLLPVFRTVRRARAAEIAALSFKEREELKLQRSQAWTQMLSSVGVLAGVAFTAASLIYTARTLQSTQEGQITDRYTKAVEQLGNKDSRDARTGAIYALARLADDSNRDRESIINVLVTYVDDHIRADAEPRSTGGKPAPTSDVIAALSKLIDLWKGEPGDAGPEHPFPSLDLRGLDLTDTVQLLIESKWLAGANLADVDLHGTSLEHIVLYQSNLSGADLSGAWLVGSNLADANLSNSRLSGANLKDADLTGADLRGADLSPNLDAKTKFAEFHTETNFIGANLKGADLRQARGMTVADIKREATIDEETRF
jgi:hypothetical protein